MRRQFRIQTVRLLRPVNGGQVSERHGLTCLGGAILHLYFLVNYPTCSR